MREAVDVAEAWSVRRRVEFDPSPMRSLLTLLDSEETGVVPGPAGEVPGGGGVRLMRHEFIHARTLPAAHDGGLNARGRGRVVPRCHGAMPARGPSVSSGAAQSRPRA